MSDLFPDAYADSPRLRWMRRWGVSVRKEESCFIAEIDEDLWGAGPTQEEALEDLVTTCGLPHWKERIL